MNQKYNKNIESLWGEVPHCDATDWKCQYGSWHWTMLTALLLLLHTRAGTVEAPDIVGAFWGHRGQQGITWGNWWKDVISYQFLHFTGPGVSIGAMVPRICRNLVKGDGAIVEVQCGRRGHVRSRVMLVEIWGAVAKDGLLFNVSAHQIRCADRWRGHHCQTMSTGLDLQLLQMINNKKWHHVDNKFVI